ncbi:MAG: hypothetical protein JWO60_1402 [Frankiales bacterium]|nr:hypothetical protein [Frankiales bacterium]
MSPVKRAVRVLFVLAVLVGLGLYLRSRGDDFLSALRDADPLALLLSFALVLAGLFASAMVWRALLTELGSRLPLRSALHVFFLGQLGKYVPGSVFAVAAQMELGRDQGVSRARTGTASLLFMGVLVAAGLLVAVGTLPFVSPEALEGYGWVLVALPLGLVLLAPPVLTRLVALALRVLKREPLERPLSAKGLGAALGWALAMWALYGLHLLVLVRTQPLDDGPDLLLLTLGGYALAWVVGFIVILAPAGGGLREIALVVVLAPVLDEPRALAVALLSRVVMTAGDLLWGGVGARLRPPVVESRSVQQQGKAADV